jgi:hypothetical protein
MWRPRFVPRAAHVGFVVDQVAQYRFLFNFCHLLQPANPLMNQWNPSRTDFQDGLTNWVHGACHVTCSFTFSAHLTYYNTPSSKTF